MKTEVDPAVPGGALAADYVYPLEQRVNVLGVGISPYDLNTAAEAVLAAVRDGRQGYVGITGVHGVSEAQGDSDFKRILNGTLFNMPDGMPMVWYGQLEGRNSIGRVYGPDLMLRLSKLSAGTGLKHFLFGGGDGVAMKLRDSLTARFPELEIPGINTPPFRPLTDQEEIDLRDSLNELGADLIWVGLSTPKQEKFMSSFLRRFSACHGGDGSLKGAKVFLGVGAAFDFHAGLVPQAPAVLQDAGLEWAYRLYSEPKRLWRRYLKNNPVFVARAAAQLTGLRKYQLAPQVDS